MGLRRLLKDNMAVSVDVDVCLEVAFCCFSAVLRYANKSGILDFKAVRSQLCSMS